MYVCARVASDLEAAEKRIIAFLREDAVLVCYLLLSSMVLRKCKYVCMYRGRASGTVQCGFVYAER